MKAPGFAGIVIRDAIMSIQSHSVKHSFLDKVYDLKNILIQVNQRRGVGNGVYLRYKTRYTHVAFDRYYDHPPLKWANWYDAKCFHWINYPARYFNFNSPYIIEINDCPLSAAHEKNFSSEPVDVLRRIDVAHRVYSHNNCKSIIMTCAGMHELFKYYFGNSFDEKIIYAPQPGCLAKPVNWEAKKRDVTHIVCLASDYETKGVDLVLAAWRSIQNYGKSTLTIACPNVPNTEQDAIQTDHSIRLIPQAPLTEQQKHIILSSADISIGSHHIHGGTNIMEGLEYGHFPFVFQYHLTAFNECGEVIKMPYWFYKAQGYGTEWRTFKEYKSKLREDKKAGIFDSVIIGLANRIKYYLNEREQCINAGMYAYESAKSNLSYERRNQILRNLYRQIIGTKFY